MRHDGTRRAPVRPWGDVRARTRSQRHLEPAAAQAVALRSARHAFPDDGLIARLLEEGTEA